MEMFGPVLVPCPEEFSMAHHGFPGIKSDFDRVL